MNQSCPRAARRLPLAPQIERALPLARQRRLARRGIHRRGIRLRRDAAGGGARSAAHLRRPARRGARLPGLRHLLRDPDDVLERALPLSPPLRPRRRVHARHDHGHPGAGAVLRLSTQVPVHHGDGEHVPVWHCTMRRTSTAAAGRRAVPDLRPGIRGRVEPVCACCTGTRCASARSWN